jgi:hypothetical protein
MLSLRNSWIFLIIGSSSSYHGQVYVIIDWRPCPLSLYIYLSLSLYMCLVVMQSVNLQKNMKNLKSVVLSGQKVLTGQSLAGPNNVWLAQTMSGQSWVQGYLNPEPLPSSLSLTTSGRRLLSSDSGDQGSQGRVRHPP